LDGEKNLKKRFRPKDIERYILNTFEPDRILFVGECVSEQPSTELYQYTGKLNICGENFALNANQLLLKGATLKNTDWVVAFVLYTGGETKLMMNSQSARFKNSKVERKMNRLVMYNVLAQVILCSIVAIIGSFWYREYEGEKKYIPFEYNVGTNGVISFFSYFLLMSTLLPISLIVTLEIVKVV
jgi:magnesium-transporting ATPase (P-type)